jgi:exopolysaccharide biosynthesis predicted pyruvyltransferase EpsI
MNSSTGTALLGSLKEELSQYSGKRVFFEPLEGNNGDKLIEMGSHTLLHSIGVKLVNNPQNAEAIVINGGAGMTDIWSHGFGTLKNYNTRYPNTPLIILPSSFVFTKTDFPALFRDRIAPAFVYARERYSLKILEDLVYPDNVHLGIDHDMAFQLQNTPYLQQLQASKAQRHILIVERNDPESVTKAYQPQKNGLKSYIPWSVKRPINRHFLWPIKRARISKRLPQLGINTAFVKEWHKQVLEDYPELQGLPVCAADISSPDLSSFNRFGQLIAEAAVVVGTRLHVGILAAMLDKPTYIKSGSYHKIRGIYEYSLANRNNVQLI